MTMHREFEVPGPIEAEIHLASGEVVVETGLEGRVKVELVAHDEESQRLVDDARVELQGNRLIVDVPQKRGRGLVFGKSGIDCRVHCPDGTDVAARTKSADVRTHGTVGSLTVATASGDVRADRATGPVTAKTASGDVVVHEALGNVTAQTASGDVDLGAVSGTLTVQTASG